MSDKLDKLIMSQPKHVRDVSKLEKVRVSIPANISPTSIRRSLQDDLNEKKYNTSKGVMAASTVNKKDMKSIFNLLVAGGR